MYPAEIHCFIKWYSERLKSEGFTVKNIICPECVSPVINGVTPEIYAEEGDVKRIIAVKEGAMTGGLWSWISSGSMLGFIRLFLTGSSPSTPTGSGDLLRT